MRGLAPFAASSDAAPRLLFSSVFRDDPTYRRFYRIWQDINRGIAAVFGDFLGMPLARTFELYELWCFLRLVRAAVDEYGHGSADVSELFQIQTTRGVVLRAGGVTVSVGSGWKLCFQRTYREFWVEPDQRGSFQSAHETGSVDRSARRGRSGEPHRPRRQVPDRGWARGRAQLHSHLSGRACSRGVDGGAGRHRFGCVSARAALAGTGTAKRATARQPCRVACFIRRTVAIFASGL